MCIRDRERAFCSWGSGTWVTKRTALVMAARLQVAARRRDRRKAAGPRTDPRRTGAISRRLMTRRQYHESCHSRNWSRLLQRRDLRLQTLLLSRDVCALVKAQPAADGHAFTRCGVGQHGIGMEARTFLVAPGATAALEGEQDVAIGIPRLHHCEWLGVFLALLALFLS